MSREIEIKVSIDGAVTVDAEHMMGVLMQTLPEDEQVEAIAQLMAVAVARVTEYFNHGASWARVEFDAIAVTRPEVVEQ